MCKSFFLPVNTGYYERGLPTKDCLKFYSDRSNPETYCVIVGNIATESGFGSTPNTGKISDNLLWRTLSESILSKGAKPGIQLANSWEGYHGQHSFVNSNWDEYSACIREKLKTTQLDDIFNDLRSSIDLAIYSGFEHIQIHAAHGYLLSLLLDPFFYDHTNAVLQAIDQIGDYLKKRVESSIRLSMYCGLSEEAEVSRMRIIEKIFLFDYNYFDLSEGYYNFDKTFIYPDAGVRQKNRLQRYLKVVKNYPDNQFILSGIWTITTVLPQNSHPGYCRNVIADPNFLIKSKISCTLCGGCHYHSKGQQKLTCTLW